MIDYSHGVWSIGTYAFWIVVGAAVTLAVITVIGTFVTNDASLAGVGGTVALITAVLAVIAFWPLNTTYHQWYPVRGTVAATPGSRIQTHGDANIRQRFVIRFNESTTLYGCDDTRCSAAEPGQTLALLCKRQWQLRGDPGWVCKYDRP